MMKAVVKNKSLCCYCRHLAPIFSLSLGSVAIRRLSPPRRSLQHHRWEQTRFGTLLQYDRLIQQDA